MPRRVLALLTCLILIPLFGCEAKPARFNPSLSHAFFPLIPDSVWTYQVNSKSQRRTYVVTDKAVVRVRPFFECDWTGRRGILQHGPRWHAADRLCD